MTVQSPDSAELLRSLVERRGEFLAFVERRVNDRAQAEDILQEAFAKAVAVKDYAAERGISANNAAVRVHRARKALARELAECCGGCASAGCGDCSCER